MFAHLTLPTQRVEETTRFLEVTLGYKRKAVPPNSPVDARWLDIGNGQELHVFFVESFVASGFEAEFGRHVALFHPLDDFTALRQRVQDAGGEFIEPLRPTPFERMFFREPINGYLFEVIDGNRHRQLLAESNRADAVAVDGHT
jgi:catechol 2,3-dioxygenase-like lactoylglutathione lyase family enzyme